MRGESQQPTIRERMDVLVAMEDCKKVSAALKTATKALAWYADEKHWREDDWGCTAVIAVPDYGEGGKKARNAIRRIEMDVAMTGEKLPPRQGVRAGAQAVDALFSFRCSSEGYASVTCLRCGVLVAKGRWARDVYPKADVHVCEVH